MSMEQYLLPVNSNGYTEFQAVKTCQMNFEWSIYVIKCNSINFKWGNFSMNPKWNTNTINFQCIWQFHFKKVLEILSFFRNSSSCIPFKWTEIKTDELNLINRVNIAERQKQQYYFSEFILF